MGNYFLLACLVCFVPLMVSMARRMFFAPEAISTPAWLLATNAAFILGGPVWSWLIYGEDLTHSPRGAATVAGVIIAYSVFLTLAYSGATKAIGSFYGAPVQPAVATLKRAADSVTPTEVLIWSTVVITVQVVSLSVFSLGLSGGTMAYDYKLRIPYAVMVLYMLLGGAALGVSAILSKIAFGKADLTTRFMAIALLLIEYAITIYSGRRELIWLTLAVTFGLIWSGRRRWITALPFAFGFIYVLLFVFGPVFLRARVLYSGGNAPSVIESYRIALEERGSDVTGKTDLEAQKNTSWRFRTYSFWELFYDERGPGFTEGKILLQAALMTLPRALFGYSKFALGVVDENLLETKFDICNNVSLESYVDLGFVGPAVYGVIFGIVFALCDSLISFAGSRYRMMAVLNIGVLMRALFGPEANPIAYFSEFRTAIIYALLATLFAILLGRKSLQPQRDKPVVNGQSARLRNRVSTQPIAVPSPGAPAAHS